MIHHLFDEMPHRMDFLDRWAKDNKKGTPVIVTMENPNYSVVEIDEPDSAFQPVEKGRGKNAKQATWVLLLKANRAVGCLAWVLTLVWALLGAIKKRLILREGVGVASEKLGKGKLMFKILKVLLVTSFIGLGLEVFAHLRGWHLYIPHTSDFLGFLHFVYVGWLGFRADYIAPLVQALSTFCVGLFLIQSVDRMVLCLGCFWIKYMKIGPRIGENPYESDDTEGSASKFPMVLVQIPMCNEKEVVRY